MLKSGLVIILVFVVVLGASYATGIAGKFVDITGDAVKEIIADAKEIVKDKTIDRLAAAEKDAEEKLGNTIGDDKLRVNLTNPLTGDKIEYTCEKGTK